MADLSSYNVTAMGFWLPCGRTNFFDPDDDEALLDTCDLAKVKLTEGRFAKSGDHGLLESSVSRRLITVLRKKGYSHAFWLSHLSRRSKDATDPEVIILVCQNEHPTEWPSNVNIKGLVLIVDEDGFYLWLAIYEDPTEETVKDALTEYIAELMGGEFFSHFSGKDDDNIEHYVAKYESEMSLKHYRDEWKGILNFFQLNLILEGMFNSNFNPEVFFVEDFKSDALRETKKKYTLAKFANSITSFVPLEQATGIEEDVKLQNTASPQQALSAKSPSQKPSITEDILKLFTQCESGNQPIVDNLLVIELHDRCLNNVVREYIFTPFLRNTLTNSLRRLKWYIEYCRRTLLTVMISITHRRQPLLQAESPDEGLDYITGANEEQICGYVMLIAAKLPLITNVQRYINNVVEKIGDMEVKDALSSLVTSWNGLTKAIIDNIEGLERAIEHARLDRLLYEEEQVRAEQETRAEVERIQERSAITLSETENMAIGVVANIIAILAISLAALSLFVTIITATPPSNPKQPPGSPVVQEITKFFGSIPLWTEFIQFLRSIPRAWAVVVCLAILVLLYAAVALFFHETIGPIIHGFKVLMYRRFRRGHRYYYEMDIRIEDPIDPGKVQKLFEADFGKAHVRWWNKYSRQGELRQQLTGFTQPERNSYRTERMSEDEALHKVHIETDITWPKKWLWWVPFGGVRKMHSFLTYELLLHRPSKAHSYVLRELRFVAMHSKILSTSELEDLKQVIIEKFINSFLETSYQLSTDSTEEPLLVSTPASRKISSSPLKRLLEILQSLGAKGLPLVRRIGGH